MQVYSLLATRKRMDANVQWATQYSSKLFSSYALAEQFSFKWAGTIFESGILFL